MERLETTKESQSAADELPDLEEILAELDGAPTGEFPERALRGAQRRRDEIIPHLIEFIRRDVRWIRDGKRLTSDVSFFALFLLAEFKAREALPVLVEALSLPEDGAYSLFSDAITERLDAMLAALAADDLEVIEGLIRNPQNDQFVRWSAASAYLCLVRDGRMTRAEAIDRLLGHLQVAIAEKDEPLASAVVDELFNYAPQEVLGDVRRAFELNLVDESLIDLEYFEAHVKLGDAHFLESLEECRPTGIADTVEDLSGWSWYEEDLSELPEDPWYFSDSPRPAPDFESRETRSTMDLSWPDPETVRYASPRVGRNDPCPCGSGRKFKKCCGKS